MIERPAVGEHILAALRRLADTPRRPNGVPRRSVPPDFPAIQDAAQRDTRTRYSDAAAT